MGKSLKPCEIQFVLIAIFFMGSLFLIAIGSSAEGRTITVDDDGEADFPYIQDAINASEDGDVIRVMDGLYPERLVIDRTLTVIGNGPANTTIIPQESSDEIIRITSPRVFLEGFFIDSMLHNYDRKSIMITQDNCTITNCNLSVDVVGIYCTKVNNTHILNNSFSGTWGSTGISLIDSNASIILGNNIGNGLYSRGIRLRSSSNNTIHENSISGNDKQLQLQLSHDNIISNNTFPRWSSYTPHGIYLYSSYRNLLLDNTFLDNATNTHPYSAITMISSKENILRRNELEKGGLRIEGEDIEHWSTHEVDVSNTLDGKPIYFVKDRNNWTTPGDAGQIIITNSTDISVRNVSGIDLVSGIQIVHSSDIRIDNCTFRDNSYGIECLWSENNTISNCTIGSNKNYGIVLDGNSNGNLIRDNYITGNDEGLKCTGSHYNLVMNNTFITNRQNSIRISESKGNIILGNELFDEGIFIWGDSMEFWNTHVIDRSNTLDNHTIFYSSNGKDIHIPDEPGQVIIANCSDSVVNSLDLSYFPEPMFIAFCSNLTLENIEFNFTDLGLYLIHSENITVRDSVFKYVQDYPLVLRYSHNNSIRNCTILNTQGSDGLTLEFSHFNLITDCVVRFNHGDGVYLRGSDNNFLQNNTFHDNHGSGIYNYDSHNNKHYDNLCLGNVQSGIRLHGSVNNSIEGNQCEKNENSGIEIRNGDNHAIMSNTCIGIGRDHGIEISHSSYNKIASNYCEYFSSGIELDASGFNNVSNNNCSDNDYGIVLGHGCSDNLILKNICEKNWYGIGSSWWYKSENLLNVISTNYCRFNNFTGIYMASMSFTNVTGNICNNNGNGILVHSSNNNTLFKNDCSFNENSGISFSTSMPERILSQHNEVLNNTITFNQFGIKIGNQSEFTEIHYNVIMGNTEYGLTLDENATYTINATHNYWGSPSGPRHPSLNPHGKGDVIIGNVTFGPWLAEGPVMHENEDDPGRSLLYFLLFLSVALILALMIAVIRPEKDIGHEQSMVFKLPVEKEEKVNNGETPALSGPVNICDYCGREFEFHEDDLSIRIRCPHCGKDNVRDTFR